MTRAFKHRSPADALLAALDRGIPKDPMNHTPEKPTMEEAKEHIRNNFGCTFQVVIQMHTPDAFLALDSPQRVRDAVGEALSKFNIEEEIDFTLDVNSKY